MRYIVIALLVAILLPFISSCGSTTVNHAETKNQGIEVFPSLKAILPNATYFDTLPEDAFLTPEGYLNTTNPYSDALTVQSAMDEVDNAEGTHPIYVLVFADEEEREFWDPTPDGSGGEDGNDGGYDEGDEYWKAYAITQLERGDEALVAKFGIDIRIIDLLSFDNLWKSDNNFDKMTQIFDDLISETHPFLGCYYSGTYWTAYVDAIVGITRQWTNDDAAALASNDTLKDKGLFFVLLRWQAYWADDNVVQHEFAHLFYADDHWNTNAPCCVMTQSHYHYVTVLWEDGTPYVFYCYIMCAYLQYDWCSNCKEVINQYKCLFRDDPYKLVIRYEDPYNLRGQISALGVYTYSNPTTVTVSATNGNGWIFSKWVLDGQVSTVNPIEVNINKKRHTLVAYFEKGCKLTVTVVGRGSTNPPQGEYWYREGTQVTVTAFQGELQYWELDGNRCYDNPITVTMNRDHQLKAYFNTQQQQPSPSQPAQPRGGGGRWYLYLC